MSPAVPIATLPAPVAAPAMAPSPSYACQLVHANLQLCGVEAASVPSTTFATCAATALGLAPADASAIIPRTISDTTAGSCSSPGANSSCCCDTAAMVQFDVSAADVAVANVYAAAMTDSLTGPAMVQCLQVNASQALKLYKAVNLLCVLSKIRHHRPLLPSFFTQYACTFA